MVETFQRDSIAFGWDNIAGLTNVEEIKVNGQYLVAPMDLSQYSEGLGSLNGEGVDNPQGFPSTSWVFGHMPLLTWEYFFARLGGKRSGKVTIQTRRYLPDYYLIANAVANIGDPPSLNKVANAYTPLTISFTRIEVLEEAMIHGQIYLKDGAAQQADITTTPVLLTGFAANGLSSGVTADHTADSLTVLYGGTYEFQFHIRATKTASQLYKFNIRVNAVEGNYQTSFPSDTDTSAFASMNGRLSLDVDDVLTIYVETDDATAGTHLTAVDAQFSVLRIVAG